MGPVPQSRLALSPHSPKPAHPIWPVPSTGLAVKAAAQSGSPLLRLPTHSGLLRGLARPLLVRAVTSKLSSQWQLSLTVGRT